MRLSMLTRSISRVLPALLLMAFAAVYAADVRAQGLGSEEHFVNVLRRSTSVVEPAAITYLVLDDRAVAFALAPEAVSRLQSSSARATLRQQGDLFMGEVLNVDEAGVVDGGCIPIPIWLRWFRGRYELVALGDEGEVLARIYPDVEQVDNLFTPQTINLRDTPKPKLSEKIRKLGEILIIIADVLEKVGLSVKDDSGATWTEWLNRDHPSGSGDFETLADFVTRGQACATPLDVECRTLDDRDWSQTGQSYTCEQYLGGVCRNSDQSSGRCLNYKVRFLCAD